MSPARIDPQSGKMTVIVAGLLSAATIIAYTANTSRPRADVRVPADVGTPTAGLAELGTRAQTAREQLDGEQMAALVVELENFERRTTLATKSTLAKIDLLELHAAIALEASIRAEVDAVGRTAAQAVAAASITRARELGQQLADYSGDRGRVDAALARAELASGTDITESFPLVLLPSFRDPELRAAAVSAPVWRGPQPSPALAKGILAQLEATERQSTLVRLLTATALARSGANDAALARIDDVLADVPRQPLARAMQRALAAPTVVAVADPPIEDDVPEILEAGEPPAPTPAVTPPPVVPPVVATPTPEPVADPDPTPPAATPKPPKPATPKPATPKPEAEPKKKGYDALLAQGCKLVRSGDAAAGFEILKEAFDLNPNAVAVTVCMAEAHHELGRDASARALCERALRKSPSDRRALLLAAALEIARGNESAALAHYRKVLENHPDDAKAKAYVEGHGG